MYSQRTFGPSNTAVPFAYERGYNSPSRSKAQRQELLLPSAERSELCASKLPLIFQDEKRTRHKNQRDLLL